MNKLLTISLFVLLSNITLFAQNNNEKETINIFEVQINSKTYTVEEGNDLEIDENLKKPTISIKLSNIKKFNAGGLSFDYPSNFSFEVEKSTGYNSWTLDGNDYVIMIFDFGEQTKIEDLIDAMIVQFGRENSNTKEIKSRLGERKLEGTQLLVELAGQNLAIDFFLYNATENNTKIIAFQDSTDEEGNSSNEALTTLKLINDTILYK